MLKLWPCPISVHLGSGSKFSEWSINISGATSRRTLKLLMACHQEAGFSPGHTPWACHAHLPGTSSAGLAVSLNTGLCIRSRLGTVSLLLHQFLFWERPAGDVDSFFMARVEIYSPVTLHCEAARTWQEKARHLL